MLSGNSLIWGVKSALRGLVNYNGTGTIKSVTDLGIELDATGKMSFNQGTFSALSSSQIAGAYSFLGSATTGFGALSASLAQYSDPITGAIKLQQDQFDAADTRLTAQVSRLTDQLNQMQTTLSAKLQAADSQLAQMQSQQQLLSSTIQGLNFASYGYQNNNYTSFTPSSGG
jgi:flagellar capping protein FliD